MQDVVRKKQGCFGIVQDVVLKKKERGFGIYKMLRRGKKRYVKSVQALC